MASLDSDVKDIKNTLAAGTPASGQATMANSTPVVIASDQSAVPVSIGNGADVNSGATTDAVVAAGAAGTISAKLRRLTTDVAALLTGIVLAAGEAVIGKVGGVGDLIDCTLTLDTSAYADGDVMADTQVLSTTAMRVNDGTGILQSLIIEDEDDQGVGMDVLFFSANVSLGTENAAPSISDSDMRNYLGRVSVSASDFTDWGGVRTATKTGIGLFLKAGSGVRTIWTATVVRGGTPTYTASGVRLRAGILHN